MERLSAIFLAILLTAGIFAQAPQKISYQAVIRNNDNGLVINTPVGLKISILKSSSTDSSVYVETHLPTTNANGLLSIEIGSGTPVTGNIDTIDWANGPFFIKTEIDPAGGTNYSITGISQILSVPYALYAKKAESIAGEIIKHYVGELYGGGIIFFVDHTGQHGLICNMLDLSTVAAWSSAVQLCLDYTNADYGTGLFSDWYLPATDQLIMLHNERYTISKTIENDSLASTTKLSENFYWSSTADPNDGTLAWYYRMQYGGLATIAKDRVFAVRAIREF